MRLHPAAGRAEKVAPAPGVGIHQKQPILDQQDTPHGEAGRQARWDGRVIHWRHA